MDRKIVLPMLIALALATLFLSACTQPTPAAAPAVTLNPTATSIPPTDTATSLPPTNTPVPPTDTPVPPTDTPIPTDTPMPTSTPTLAPTDTPVPPTNTPVPPTVTRVPPTGPPKPTSTGTVSAPLAYSLETRPITPLTDAMFKLLGRQGITLCVLDSYPADLTFWFPGQVSQTGVIGTNYQDVRVWTPAIGRQMFSSPFTIPSNGMMCILWQPGTYTWTASIVNVGQAQGDVTISSGHTFVLTFRQ